MILLEPATNTRRRPSSGCSISQIVTSAYFAMVMATGIVAIAAHFTGFERCAWVLAGLNYVFAVVLYILYVARSASFPQAILSATCSPRRAVGS